MLKKVSSLFQKNKLNVLILFGTLTWSLVMVRNGLCWDKGCIGGIGFWGANGHDGVWHIALINSLSQGSFQMPVFSGWNIQNYHIGFDLFLSWIVRLTGLSASILYFQIIPPILALLIGLFTYKFVLLWRKSEKEALWSTFFVYFGGSFGWLVSFIRGNGWGGESMFWSMQATSTLINPPFALSLIFILLGLIYLIKFLAKKSKVNLLLTIFFLGTVIFIKVYAGLLVLTSLLIVGLLQIIRRKDFSIFIIFFISLLISILLFVPFNKSSASLISFTPFWFLESMMALSDRVGWQRFYSAMTTYRMGNIWIKAVPAYIVAFAIFIIGNFGTRIIAIKSAFKKPSKMLSAGPIEPLIFMIIILGILVPTFFVQTGVSWNTIQFLYYSLFLAGIISGTVVGNLIINSKVSGIIKYFIIIGIILLTVPTTINLLGNYIHNPQSILPNYEIEALNFLEDQTSGVVLTYPYLDKNYIDYSLPLYLYTTSAYVSAFSNKTSFLEDETNLGIMRFPFEERRKSVDNFLNTLDEKIAYNFLRSNNITYVYWLKGQSARVGDKQLGLTKIFDNIDVKIFKVN